MPICYVRIIWFGIIVDYIVILSVSIFFGQVPFTAVIMPNFSL
jgi:ABC-type enterochelin transport system permease subunit